MSQSQRDYYTSILKHLFEVLRSKECCEEAGHCHDEDECCEGNPGKNRDKCCNRRKHCCHKDPAPTPLPVPPEENCCEKFEPLRGIALFRVGVPTGRDEDKYIESYEKTIRKTGTLRRLEAEGYGVLFVPVCVGLDDVEIFPLPCHRS